MIDLSDIGIKVPDCPQCGDPMRLTNLHLDESVHGTFGHATFECEKIPRRIGHQFSMWNPGVCIRCGLEGVGWDSPCSKDKTDHDYVIVKIDSGGNRTVEYSW